MPTRNAPKRGVSGWLTGPALLGVALTLGCGRPEGAEKTASNATGKGSHSGPSVRPAPPQRTRATRASVRPVDRPALTIRITHSDYRVAGAPVAPAALRTRLQGLSPAERGRGVLMELLPGVPKQRVIALFDLLQQTGIRRFAVHRVAAAAARPPASGRPVPRPPRRAAPR